MSVEPASSDDCVVVYCADKSLGERAAAALDQDDVLGMAIGLFRAQGVEAEPVLVSESGVIHAGTDRTWTGSSKLATPDEVLQLAVNALAVVALRRSEDERAEAASPVRRIEAVLLESGEVAASDAIAIARAIADALPELTATTTAAGAS